MLENRRKGFFWTHTVTLYIVSLAKNNIQFIYF